MSDLMENGLEAAAANTFANHIGIQVTDIQKDLAEATLAITPETMNLYGVAHGGALFTLADVCAGMAARTDGRTYVTQQANVQFLRAARGGMATARSHVLHRGGTVCLIQVEITDEEKQLLLAGTFTFYCLHR